MSINRRGSGSCCSAFGCSMRRGTNLLSQVKMFSFPSDPVRRAAWRIAVRRANWIPKKNSLICNFHFVTGKPSTDPKHPDYVPSIFSFSKITAKEEQKKIQRYERSIKQEVKQDLKAQASSTASTNERWVSLLKPTAVSSLFLPVVSENVKKEVKTKQSAKRQARYKKLNRDEQMHVNSEIKKEFQEEVFNTDDHDKTTSRLDEEMLVSDINSEFMDSKHLSSHTKEVFLEAISKLPAEQQAAIKSCHSFKAWFL